MPESTKPRVAVIGLGSMGFGMATSLKRAGFEVTGCDVSAESVARFVADGGKGAKTPAEAAKAADIVVSVVVNAAQTETILFGANGVAETLAKGAVFISSATMDPDVARRLAKQLEATGRHYLDAPISGGAQRAAQGELTILASGSPAAFAKARPALDAMAAKLYELGDDAGQGAAFKMINQLLAGVHIAAASEAIAFAAKQGLDIRKVYEVITASAGNSWMFENRMPHVLDGDYAPRSAVEIFVKDLGIIQDMARTAEIPGAGRRRGAADVSDDGGIRHGPRRRCLGGADVCPGSPARICPANRNSKIKKRTADAPFCRQSLHDVQRGPVPRPLRCGGESGLYRGRIPVSLRSSGGGRRRTAEAQRPDTGVVQFAAGQLGRRRERFCGAAGSLRRSEAKPDYGTALRARRPASSGCI